MTHVRGSVVEIYGCTLFDDNGIFVCNISEIIFFLKKYKIDSLSKIDVSLEPKILFNSIRCLFIIS